MKRHKCQFALSFCSVFVVVLSILCVVSITRLGPIIFLRLSEKDNGEYDGIFKSRYLDEKINFSHFKDMGRYLSYSNLQQQISATANSYKLAPRNQFCES